MAGRDGHRAEPGSISAAGFADAAEEAARAAEAIRRAVSEMTSITGPGP